MEGTLYTPSPPQASICLSDPSLNTLVSPSLLFPLIHSLSPHFSLPTSFPAVDLQPPPPNSTQSFSFWVIFLFRRCLFMTEVQRERDKKPSAELAPEGCEGSKSVTCNTQTHVHINTKRKSTWNARVHACECTSTHTHTRLTLLQHAAFSVSHHVQTEAFCP